MPRTRGHSHGPRCRNLDLDCGTCIHHDVIYLNVEPEYVVILEGAMGPTPLKAPRAGGGQTDMMHLEIFIALNGLEARARPKLEREETFAWADRNVSCIPEVA